MRDNAPAKFDLVGFHVKLYVLELSLLHALGPAQRRVVNVHLILTWQGEAFPF
jgi:hypothetical protein